MRDLSYTNTLNYFFNNSNENIVDGQAVGELILRHFSGYEGLMWLDVGCGPATKLCIVANYLLKQQGKHRITLDCLDPSMKWLDIAGNSIRQAGSNLKLDKLFCTTWEDFSSKTCGEKYDVISFMHSVYGMKTINGSIPSLMNANRFLKNNGLIIIIIESPNSDLYKIKSSIFKTIANFPLVNYKHVERSLEFFNTPYEVMPENNQQFRLGSDENSALNNVSALSFIIQTTPNNYCRMISDDEKDLLAAELKKVLRFNEVHYYLQIPDIIYCIYK